MVFLPLENSKGSAGSCLDIDAVEKHYHVLHLEETCLIGPFSEVDNRYKLVPEKSVICEGSELHFRQKSQSTLLL